MEKIMTTEEYAKIRGITQQAVRKACAKGWNMPGVVEVLPKSGKYWLLKVLVSNYKK